MKDEKREKYFAPTVERKSVEVEKSIAASLTNTTPTGTTDNWNYDQESNSGTTIDGWNNQGSLN